MVFMFEQWRRNSRKSPEDSNKTGAAAENVQQWPATTEIATNNTERNETMGRHDPSFQTAWRNRERWSEPVLHISNMRVRDKKVIKMRSRLDVRKFFFSQRVVNTWNNLPASVVQATSVNMLKNAYDRHIAGGMDAWADSCMSTNLQATSCELFTYLSRTECLRLRSFPHFSLYVKSCDCAATFGTIVTTENSRILCLGTNGRGR